MARGSHFHLLEFFYKIFLLLYGDPRTRISKLLIGSGILLIIVPWWQPILQALIVKHLSLDASLLEGADRWALMSGWILIVVGVILYWRASTQPVTPKPILKLSVFDQNSRSILLAAPLRKGRVLEYTLQIMLENTGGATARDFEIIVSMPKAMCHGGSEVVEFSFQSDRRILTGQTLPRTGERQYFLLECDRLHPKQVGSIRLPISFGIASLAATKIRSKTADGVEVEAFVDGHYTLYTILHCADCEPIVTDIKIRVVNTYDSDVSKVLNRINRVISKRHVQQLKAMSLWSRLRYRMSSEKIAVVVLEASQMEHDKDLPIDRPAKGSTVTVASGKLLDAGFFIPAFKVLPAGVQSEQSG